MHPDRLFPPDQEVRRLARELYGQIRDLPIISPHGHTDPSWFADNLPFSNPLELLVLPDHYVLRMLYSQGISFESLMGDARAGWRVFSENFYLFRGTPSHYWLRHVFSQIFEITERLDGTTADSVYDHIQACLERPGYLPRALFERFRIEVLATTDAACDDLDAHRRISQQWTGRVIPTYRPDACVDPEHPQFAMQRRRLGELTGQDTDCLEGYLQAHRLRRQFFRSLGATASDHGPPSPATLSLSRSQAEQLFARVLQDPLDANNAEQFRAFMLVEMARMAAEDGLVMQLHAGSLRNHNTALWRRQGPDRGADIPQAMEYTHNLRPLLEELGNHESFRLIVFTLDESTYARELAPLAGHYPALLLGPPWWFHDSPEGMLRYRQHVTETAGFYNTAGFNDDTRAFLSIPARHDMARRMDCRFLAQWVAEHRLSLDEARELALDLTHNLVRRAYRLSPG